ncbi:MAG: cupin domain-containing protein [Gammaproteobacteria bacterium]|nr:cupin domain-containing protein [Gammaproteobacteria bacterium]
MKLNQFFVLLPLLISACSAKTSSLPDPLAAGWAGEPVCELLYEDSSQRALRCSFAPGQGHEKHFHAPHFGYALSGGEMRLTDATGSRDVTLATGSSFHSNGTDWHEVLNIGSTTVRYLIIETK